MLGSATVLCVDKTGTLTQNRMTLSALHAGGQHFDVTATPDSGLPEHFHELLEFAMLASQRDPFDPMDKAIKAAIERLLAGTEHVHSDWTLVDEYPLSPGLLAISRVWQSPNRASYVIAAKGAPEAIVDLCHLPADAVTALTQITSTLAAQGLRVLGVAKATFRQGELPSLQHDFAFAFIGFIGLADPVRETVPGAVAEARAAGIRVVMITGDYPSTAMSIGREASALVLLDDDFSSIVTAVRLGRRVFDNLRKAFGFVIAVHVPIVGMSVIPIVLGWPLLLLPVHILFLQLIIDPSCSIVFEAEPEEPDTMKKPPRPRDMALLDRTTVLLGCVQGVAVLAALLAVYGIALHRGQSTEEARALAFTVMVFASLSLILASRSRQYGSTAASDSPG